MEGRENILRQSQTNLGALITNAIAKTAPKSQAVILNSGSIRLDDQLIGDITQLDVIRALPYGGTIVEADLKGELLEEVLNISHGENHNTGGYLQLHNIKPKEETGTWLINNKDLDPSAVYRIALPAFLISGREQNLDFFKEGHEQILKIYKEDVKGK